MKITSDMVDDSLKPYFWPMKLLAFMLSKKSAVKLINKASARRKGANVDDLHCQERYIPSRNGGPAIRIRIFKPLNVTGELPGFLYLHGGGYLIGTPENYPGIIKKFVNAGPCILIAPDYRKALEAPYPAALNDCYDTLLWLKENAQSLGAIPDKFIVGGHSAGGGLTAAVALKARDTKDVDIAFQMPIYPMIDDRQITESASDTDSPVWSSKTNKLGWHLYLKELREKGLEIPAYAAPARATDYANLPPTITFVGDLEPFRDETIEYVENLRKMAVPVEFKLFEGCYHGFDEVAPDSEVAQQAWRFVLDRFSNFIDAHFQ